MSRIGLARVVVVLYRVLMVLLTGVSRNFLVASGRMMVVIIIFVVILQKDAFADPKYYIIDLGALPEQQDSHNNNLVYSVGIKINNNSEVIGVCAAGSQTLGYGAVFRNGQIALLGGSSDVVHEMPKAWYSGNNENGLVAINDHGTVTGTFAENNEYGYRRAFLLNDTGYTFFSPWILPLNYAQRVYSSTYVMDMNNSDSVVGYTEICGNETAYRYAGGEMRFIGFPFDIDQYGHCPKTLNSKAYGINDKNLIVGWANFGTSTLAKLHACTFENDMPNDIGCPEEYGDLCFASAVNDKGQILIAPFTLKEKNVYIYENNTFSQIAMCGDKELANVSAMNNKGDIVGRCGNISVLYIDNKKYKFIDTVVNQDILYFPGWNDFSVLSINDKRELTGYMLFKTGPSSAVTHAFKAVPVNPSTTAAQTLLLSQ
ncbi:MAG: DUF3466 family protein [Solidesulfovibrio sp. DCME]|uniref:DUF3466 family protein n=1 Tax=Solidesulfovibrio sp. DCME TaxID=3447380 RepID=UPI003D0B6DAD